MTRRLALRGLWLALAVILSASSSSRAQVSNWGSGWITPADSPARDWYPPRRSYYRNYLYYPAPASYTAEVHAARPAPADNSVLVHVQVPAHAEVWFDGSPTTHPGTNRVYQSPPLQPGKLYHYFIRARWTTARGKVVDQTRRVLVQAGQNPTVNFLD